MMAIGNCCAVGISRREGFRGGIGSEKGDVICNVVVVITTDEYGVVVANSRSNGGDCSTLV